MREQGSIEIEGSDFVVRKQGFASGIWTLESGGRVLLTARKENPFRRTLIISGHGTETQLRAASVFSRSMILNGRDIDCRIEPLHPFTRRATITGQCAEPQITCFAFWLTVVLWRRAAGNNAATS